MYEPRVNFKDREETDGCFHNSALTRGLGGFFLRERDSSKNFGVLATVRYRTLYFPYYGTAADLSATTATATATAAATAAANGPPLGLINGKWKGKEKRRLITLIIRAVIRMRGMYSPREMGKSHGDRIDDVLYLAREQQLYRWPLSARGSLNTTKNVDMNGTESRRLTDKEIGVLELAALPHSRIRREQAQGASRI